MIVDMLAGMPDFKRSFTGGYCQKAFSSGGGDGKIKKIV
ncbi:hypothetical protein DCCM_3448 [Desulfocucumis palustris]|uniref:Uncharacterized protein n=1 Tax=Desulfocucumis palustris TaxID=1898651 RepID=A0A2L2XJA6_9FIRM|nr:hypothetical protein DCCM_3448 [Desulfocucumis palustris]